MSIYASILATYRGAHRFSSLPSLMEVATKVLRSNWLAGALLKRKEM